MQKSRLFIISRICISAVLLFLILPFQLLVLAPIKRLYPSPTKLIPRPQQCEIIIIIIIPRSQECETVFLEITLHCKAAVHDRCACEKVYFSGPLLLAQSKIWKHPSIVAFKISGDKFKLPSSPICG